jgi:predicted ester cyclase
MMRAAFRDFAMTIEDMVAEGDKVFIRATMKGTQQGEFMGIPASGKQMAVPCADLVRISGGRILEHWGITDTGAMMRQLT